MKNWTTLDADINLILDKHYTEGRSGKNIDKVVVHHNAGNLTAEQIYNVWQNREASAHYQVNGTRVSQHVWDSDTAWHAGNWDANCTSIGIEHADTGNAAPWSISDETLDTGAHLVAAVCRYYKLGRPEWGKNVFLHSDFSATACPASIGSTQKAAYMAAAQSWYDKMGGGTSAPATPSAPALKDVTTVAREVMAGQWGNGADRTNRLTAAGYDANAVQAKVNELMGVGGSASVDLEALATAVIRGDYGNGDERRRRLGANYDAVMAIVNERYGL